MIEGDDLRLSLPLTAKFDTGELSTIRNLDEVVVILREVAVADHPDRVRIAVASKVETAREYAKQVTLRLSQFGTRYFDEDIIQFVQLLESGVDRLLLSGSSREEVAAASELLDEVEGRFRVSRPLRIGISVTEDVDASHLGSLCDLSERVDSFVVDAMTFTATQSESGQERAAESLARIRTTVCNVAAKRRVAAIGGPSAPTDPPDTEGYHDMLRDHGFVGAWIRS